MRTITKTLYKYKELPTAEARERVRNEWCELEQRDPAWHSEHMRSMHTVAAAVLDNTLTLDDLKSKAQNCEFTGYVSDYLLLHLLEGGNRPDAGDVHEHFFSEWSKELDERLSDVEHIESSLDLLDKEYYEDGTFYEGEQ